MRYLLLPTALLCLAVAGVTRADDEQTATYGVADAGASTCRLMTDMYHYSSTGTERQFFTWAQGYFPGLGAAQPPGNAALALSASGPERQRQFQAMLDYCHENPDALFIAAVESLRR